MTALSPFIYFYLATLLMFVVRGKARTVLMLATPLISAYFLAQQTAGDHQNLSMLGYTLNLYSVDSLSILFGYLFHLAAFIGIIFSLHVRDELQQFAAMSYAGSALGAVFAGDLITLFIFWELLALTSVFLIWARHTERAYKSGVRYLVIQVASGMLLLIGVLAHIANTGDNSFSYIGTDSIAGWVILAALGIKAAFPFAHNWLTDAYAEATPTGTVFLSAFTTKVAIYALARCYPGTELLVYVGVSMAAFPIFYAVIENDLRRVLGYSMINQLGFMVVGIGIGTELALNGAVAHAFTDVIFKGLLFMSMGAVLHMTGRINGSDLGGLYKSMPYTTGLCIVGAASISAFPLFSGFVSKSMVMSAAMHENYVGVWLVLLFASAGVFHHAGIKIPFFAFFAHDSGIRTSEPPMNMRIAMTISAALCLAIGIYPELLYQLLPFDTGYNPYDASHVIAQTQLLFFSALAFVWLKLAGLYPAELHSINIDAEWLYRRLGPRLWKTLLRWTNCFSNWLTHLSSPAGKIINHKFLNHCDEATLARSWPTGSMVLWVAVLLCISLIFYYL